MGSLALVFAELTDGLAFWEEGLEGFAVRGPSLLRREREERRREDLIRVLRLKFKDAAEPLVPRVQSESDATRLAQWFDIAVTEGLDKVREAMGG